MIAPLLVEQLEPVARRYRRWQMWRGLAICWVGAALVGGALISLQQLGVWSANWTMPALATAAGLGGLIVWWRTRTMDLDLRWVARQVEEQHPELQALLMAAVQQEPGPGGQLSYLQQRVILEAIEHSKTTPWLDTIAGYRLALAQAGQWAALILLVMVLGGFQISTTRTITSQLMKAGVTITPGDTSVEKGNALVVLARFTGPLPAGANLVIGATPESSRTIPLVKNFNDPVFGASLPEVTGDFVYHVEYANQRTREFAVKVFEHPRLEKSDATISYPAYTGQANKRIENTRRVTAVEGSKLELSLQLNKPVTSARLVAKDKTTVPLVTETNKASASLKEFPLDLSKSYELQLVDAEGRTNKMSAQFVFDVLKNGPPQLKIVSPRGDPRVSALEEINFQGEAWDDFGLKKYGFAYTLAGKETQFIELGANAPAKEKRTFNYLLRLEDLGVLPDQLVSYFVWADDTGADGQVRRTSSEMYFAEVRPFEEIFRQGEPQESEGGEPKQGGNEATKLADLQKQIISATWKLQREETGKTPSAKYKQDEPVVQESQGKALEQVQELKENAQDPRKKIQIEAAEQAMEKALRHLTDATNSLAPLPAAVAAEQAAYAALLKLASREFKVTQQRSRNSKGGGQQQRNQRQLDQLELKQAENRYETERQAKEQTPEQKEQLQVLNRLKELAQRQNDVNERLKELQNALQEAKSEQEREDIRRRLKRLREEEQQMLADVDELKQRMEKPENQAQMAESKQQLDQTRSEVQKASEALEKESVSQALTAGTRAQRELQQLRDEFRKKNSTQFAEEMRQMRNNVRELAEKEAEIGKQLDDLNGKNSKRKTLTDSNDKKELATRLDEQKKLMSNLVDHATQVTEQAETVEPLLATQLYDTLRKTAQENIENKLATTAELLRQSYAPEASQVEQKARKSIDDFKNGIEHAAESVLGDEAEALRMARKELDDLSRQVQNEVAQAAPELMKDGDKKMASAAQAGEPGEQPGEKPGQKGKNGKQGENGKEGKQASGKQPGQKGPAGKDGKEGKGQGQGKSGQPGEKGSPSDQASDQAGKEGQQGKQGEKGGKGKGGKGGEGGQGQGQQQQAQRGEDPSTQAPGQRQQAGAGGGNNNAGGGGGDIGRGGNRRVTTGRDLGGNLVNNLFNDAPDANVGPITGRGFDNWSDRMREVEEMLDNPALRGDVARIRERLRAVRQEYKQQKAEPKWDIVKAQIADSLVEVRDRVAEELARRDSRESLVPIDRDPVPSKFTDLVKKYYQDLGKNE